MSELRSSGSMREKCAYKPAASSIALDGTEMRHQLSAPELRNGSEWLHASSSSKSRRSGSLLQTHRPRQECEEALAVIIGFARWTDPGGARQIGKSAHLVREPPAALGVHRPWVLRP